LADLLADLLAGLGLLRLSRCERSAKAESYMSFVKVGYPSEVRRFFAAALDGVRQEWPDPAGYGPPVSDQMTTEKRTTAAVALRKAEVDATRAVRFEKEGRQGEALALWRDILGRYFPSA